LSIRDWADTFSVEIEPMGVDTVGGFVITLLEHIPKKGDSVIYEDFVFTIEGVRKRRITSILQEMKTKKEVDEDKDD
ncbi:MAG: transporter associated domain-containing protein, partial [Candidatus Scalindua sp.]